MAYRNVLSAPKDVELEAALEPDSPAPSDIPPDVLSARLGEAINAFIAALPPGHEEEVRRLRHEARMVRWALEGQATRVAGLTLVVEAQRLALAVHGASS
jgi:hypothetical protein